MKRYVLFFLTRMGSRLQYGKKRVWQLHTDAAAIKIAFAVSRINRQGVVLITPEHGTVQIKRDFTGSLESVKVRGEEILGE